MLICCGWMGLPPPSLPHSLAMYISTHLPPRYVCAEWTYGGIPAWLGLKPGVAFRETNAVWQPAMEAWFNVIVDRMAKGSFFASQGGPIVLVQVENELPKTDMAVRFPLNSNPHRQRLSSYLVGTGPYNDAARNLGATN